MWMVPRFILFWPKKKKIAFLRKHLTHLTSFNSPLKPCAISIVKPLLQMRKTSPKKQTNLTKALLRVRTKIRTQACFTLSWRWAPRLVEPQQVELEGTFPHTDAWRSQYVQSQNWRSTGFLIFPKNIYYIIWPLSKGRQYKLYKLTATSTTFP